jgi:hypothetical protein
MSNIDVHKIGDAMYYLQNSIGYLNVLKTFLSLQRDDRYHEYSECLRHIMAKGNNGDKEEDDEEEIRQLLFEYHTEQIIEEEMVERAHHYATLAYKSLEKC